MTVDNPGLMTINNDRQGRHQRVAPCINHDVRQVDGRSGLGPRDGICRRCVLGVHHGPENGRAIQLLIRRDPVSLAPGPGPPAPRPFHTADSIIDRGIVNCGIVHQRVDSGRGRDRTLRLLATLWPPVVASEQNVGPTKG